jgi:peptidoglycan/LPS O-acetylase OafA/YrhL
MRLDYSKARIYAVRTSTFSYFVENQGIDIAVIIMNRENSSIDPGLSVYFDLMRFFAAIIVLLNHYGVLLSLAKSTTFPGSDAVIVFFVLSGYVIAHVSEKNDLTGRRYIFDRLSRLWSVAVPATILSITIGIIFYFKNDDFRVIYLNKLFLDSFVNVIFYGESWHQTFSPYNFPYWSINYEFWYYIIFGIFMFMKGKYKIPALILACILSGPSIILFMPIWLIGVALYSYREELFVNNFVSILLFMLSIFGYWIIYHYNLNEYSRIWLKDITNGESYHLGPSTSIFSAYPIAIIVSINFISVQNMNFIKAKILKIKSFAQKISSYTLTIYLFHMPLFYLFSSIGINQKTIVEKVSIFVLSAICIMIIAPKTEHRRIAWRNCIENIWLYCIIFIRKGIIIRL